MEKEQVTGKLDELKGRRSRASELTGNPDLQDEGTVEHSKDTQSKRTVRSKAQSGEPIRKIQRYGVRRFDSKRVTTPQ